MRAFFTYGMYPLLRENMDTPIFNTGSTSFISSNGYYGFQPQINPPQKNSTGSASATQMEEQARNERMDIEVQKEESEMQIGNGNIPRLKTNRKRQWEHVVDVTCFKKRRDDADINHTLSAPPQTTTSTHPQALHMRKPTHNIPDLPRCMMGHYS